MIPRTLLTILLTLICGSASTAAYEPAKFALPGGALTLPGTAPLFEVYTTLDWKEVKAKRLLDKDFRKIEQTVSARKHVWTFSDPPEEWGAVTVVATLEYAGREVIGRLSIESSDALPVRLVRFPNVDTPKVNRYDTLLFSHNVGDAIHDPRVMIGTRLSGIYSRRYPADVAMQYMTLYNQARNHYIAAYHDGDEFYDHTVRTASDSLRMSFDWYPFLDKGGRWQSPVCSMSVLKGDWHSAADLYREHMGARFRPPVLPKWMREEFHGWVQFSLKGGEPKAAYKYTELAQLYRDKVAAFGLNTVHFFSWQNGGFHHFPDFVPSPVCGTAEELAKAMDDIRAIGGRADLYTHGTAVDQNSDFYRRDGDASLIRQEDGSLLVTSDGSTIHRVCPFSKSYQDAMVREFERIARDYRAHGCQIDTNACIPAQFCFNTAHGHRTPAAGWLPGEDALLRRIHEAYRRINPNFFVWVEGTNERLGQFYEINQAHGENQSWSAGESMPEQFHYTYPDYLCTGGSDSMDGLCHTFGQGKPFDIHNGPRLSDPGYTGLLKDFVRVRKTYPDYFLRGRFMDTVGIHVGGQDVRYWRIDRRDRKGMLVNFWGRGRGLTDVCEASIRIPNGLSSWNAVYPSSLKVTPSGRFLQLRWTGPVATVVFE